MVEIKVLDDPSFKFAPKNPDPLPAGGFFHWTWEEVVRDIHNVRQDKRLFRSGAPGDLENYPDGYEIEASAGRFHYFCELHGAAAPSTFGQSAYISVRPYSSDDPAGLPFRVIWANQNTTTGDRFDVRFRVEDGKWRDWRQDTRKVSAVFGNNDSPVRVRADREYAFKARSQKGPNDAKVSDFSPRLKVET